MKPSALGTGSLAELTSRRPNARTAREVEPKREVRAKEDLLLEAAIAWRLGELDGNCETPMSELEQDMRAAVDALLFARRGRKGGPKKTAP